jgi:galactokinase
VTALERDAAAALDAAFGPGARPATGFAPGRCTIIGEHVDYADGIVACAAIHLGIGVAVRESADGCWRARSGTRVVERADPAPAGDIGDRLFAAATVHADHARVPLRPMEFAVSATLPESAGLSSSAAVICAALVALLRLSGDAVDGDRLAKLALHAERDVVGVPCGVLDQRAVVLAPDHGVLMLDCWTNTCDTVPWSLEDVVLAGCDTGAAHDVGGSGYRDRRREAAAALERLGCGSYRAVTDAMLASARLDDVLFRRARHIVTETGRSRAACEALRSGDAVALGALMSASHASLRDDYRVSTPRLDAVVTRAEAVEGCLGARLVGAGFGGTAVALVRAGFADACRMAMTDAAGYPSGAVDQHSWVLQPGAGVRARAADVVR